jgi:peptide/nickel transport system substrate-binding protein
VSSVDELPIGTVTFLFTDIEGSTQLLKRLRDRYGEALEDHQRILREAFAEHGGHEIDTQGDSFFIAFRRAKDAVAAAIACQRRLAEYTWPDGAELRVRMGIHTGEPAVGGERYVGLGVHRAARICAAGHGGQVLVSQTARELLRDDPLPDVSLRDLGEHQLKDLDEPERIYQLFAPGLAEEFPRLKTAAPAPFEGREGELAEAAQEAVHELASPWRQHRRLLATTGAVVVGVGLAVGVLVIRGGSTANASGEVAANAVGLIDAASGKVDSEIPVGEAPSGVATGDDSIWVTNTAANSVSRIDARTNSVQQTIQVGGGPTGVAVSGEAVWVANGLDGTVSRIDAGTNQVVQAISVGNGPTGVAYGAGGVWVANSVDGTVSRIDPGTGRVTRTIPATIGTTGVAVGFGRVWVVSSTSGSLVALNPRSGEIEDRIGVGGDAAAVAVGAGAVWVANRADGTVSKIDPRARAVIGTVQVGNSPNALATGPNDVWVANSQDATLSHVDPSRDAVVRTVRLVNQPQGIALTPLGVYVAVRSTGAEHRGGTLHIAADSDAVDSIDPAVAYATDSWTILNMTNDGLVAFRRVGGIEGIQLVPDLAISMPTPTDNGSTYTFSLRPGIRYSNGRLVAPEDFRRAFERVLSVSPLSGGSQYYSGIVGADRCKPGRRCDLSRGIVTNRAARTVTFHLAAPDGDFPAKLALPFAFAVPSRTPARDVGSDPVPATGAYMIETDRKLRLVKLVRNPRFREWSPDARPDGYPDVIAMNFSYERADPTARVRAVERGALDVAPGLVPPMTKQALDALATGHPSQLHMSPAPATNFFFLNTRVGPFDDVRVRRAVNLAFDRQAFAQLLGRAFAPTCQILPPNYPSYRRTCPYGPGGVTVLDKARTLVRRSGTAGARITVWVPAPSAVQGRFMVSVLDSLGYRARLKAFPLGPSGIVGYFNSVLDSRRRVQTAYYGWSSDFPSDRSFIEPLFNCTAFAPGDPSATSNASGLCNHLIDAQIARAAAVQAQDPAAASLVWQKLERTILELAPMVPTYNRQNVDFVSERVGNYQYHPQWGPLLDQLWVK